jgi:hypothetical protein
VAGWAPEMFHKKLVRVILTSCATINCPKTLFTLHLVRWSSGVSKTLLLLSVTWTWNSKNRPAYTDVTPSHHLFIPYRLPRPSHASCYLLKQWKPTEVTVTQGNTRSNTQVSCISSVRSKAKELLQCYETETETRFYEALRVPKEK